MPLLRDLAGNGVVLVCSLALHLGCALIFVAPRPSLRLLSSFFFLCHGVAAYMLVDRRYTPSSVLPYSVAIGFEIVLYGNYHLYLTLRHPEPASASLRDKVAWVLGRVIFNPRGQVRRLPPFSRHDASYVPSRRRFLTGHLVSLALCGIIRMLLLQPARDVVYGQLMMEGDMDVEKESILRRLSEADWREVWVRTWFLFSFFVYDIILVSAFYSFIALIGVGLLGGEPAGWRPVFGSAKEAYTVQRFFNSTWHQFHRTAYTAHSKLLVQSVLRIRNPIVARSCAVLSVSAITGLNHALMVKAAGPHCEGLRQFRWWMMAGVVIILEDAFLRLVRWLAGPRLLARYGNGSAVRAMGYTWVLFYFWWSIPKAQYERLQCASLP